MIEYRVTDTGLPCPSLPSAETSQAAPIHPTEPEAMAGADPSPDLEPSVNREKTTVSNAAEKDEANVDTVGRSGAETGTIYNNDNAATESSASSSTSLNTKELDGEMQIYEHVSLKLKRYIMQSRMDKKPNQAQLAQEYKSGKTIPNQQTIDKLETLFGAKLKRKK